MTKFLILHGPNLNLLGEREHEVYGTMTLAELNERIRVEGEQFDMEIQTIQSNHEGVLIDELHAADAWAAGAVIIQAAFPTLRLRCEMRILAVQYPVIEVHLSNIHAREHFRRRSLTAGACQGVIAGLGWRGYTMGLQAIVEWIEDQGSQTDG